MLTRRTLILAKTETVEGTDIVPTAAANALLVSNCTITPQSEMLERDLYLQTLSQLGSVTGVYWGQMTFDTELRGIGAVPTAVAPLREDPLFLACGLSASYAAGSAVYKPISDFTSAVRSATLYAYLDGVLHVMTGSYGNMQMAGNSGQYGKYTWTMQGAVGAISVPYVGTDAIRDVAFPTPTYQNFNLKPPPLIGTSMNVLGGTDCVQAFAFNMNNNVVRRDCMGAASGIRGFMITGRKPGGTVNPEATTRTLQDYWGKWNDNVTGPITFVVNASTVGNWIDWSMPASQITRMGYGDRNGIRTYELEYTANMVTNAGDDEVLIAYK